MCHRWVTFGRCERMIAGQRVAGSRGFLYGPYWAGLVSSLGLGGLLAGRLRLNKPVVASAAAGLMTLASWALTTTTNIVVVVGAQIALALLIVTASIHVTRLLHDAVPSTVRSGVASGVGAISWMLFLPVALAFGVMSTRYGVHTAGWMLTAAAALAGVLLIRTAFPHETGIAPTDRDLAPAATV